MNNQNNQDTEASGSGAFPLNGFERFVIETFRELEGNERAFCIEMIWCVNAMRAQEKAGFKGLFTVLKEEGYEGL